MSWKDKRIALTDWLIEAAWAVFGFMCGLIILIGVIVALFFVFSLGFDCGLNDACVERVMQIDEALGRVP